MTLLIDRHIRKHLEWGSVVIEPFRSDRLNTDSYDLELGPWFWRYADKTRRRPADGVEGFELHDARDAGGIWLAPNERVLGHTVEIAGGRQAVRPANWLRGETPPAGQTGVPVAVTTHLQATSTAARHGITACMCAGWGDVGFVNIWTLEIENRTPTRLFLPIGSIIAQICFTEVESPAVYYGRGTGQYMHEDPSVDARTLRESWTPRLMLPGKLKVRGTWEKEDWDGWKEREGRGRDEGDQDRDLGGGAGHAQPVARGPSVPDGEAA